MVTMPFIGTSQEAYWKQEVNYKMQVDVDVERHQLNGNQILLYTNNSPDTLHEIYYHLYFNAFQPNGMMDVRSRSILDPDDRVMDRIFKLNDNEIGYHIINNLSQDGTDLSYNIEYTIQLVVLTFPLCNLSATSLHQCFVMCAHSSFLAFKIIIIIKQLIKY